MNDLVIFVVHCLNGFDQVSLVLCVSEVYLCKLVEPLDVIVGFFSGD